jgi:tetratricopeptide (TPR) repeat protein
VKRQRRARGGDRRPANAAQPLAGKASAGGDWSGQATVVVLLLAAFVLYGGSLRYPLVFDDATLADAAVLRSYSAMPPELQLRWLSKLTFGWIHAVAGMDWYWQRVLNVALHAGTAAALFGFLARLFGAAIGEQGARWPAFYGAMLFLVHPAAVYGVAYLIERSIVLAALFSLLGLRCFLEGLLRRSAVWYLGAAACYFLAVSSKEHAVMLPAAAAALAVLLRGRSISLRQLAAPAAIVGAIALGAAWQARTLIATAYEPFAADALSALLRGEHALDASLAYPLSLATQASLFFRYLLVWLLPWPGWMSVDVRIPLVLQPFPWVQCAGLVAWLAYALLAVALLRRGGRWGVAGWGLLFPWLLALTEFAVVRLQEPFVLYRSYLWMTGVFAVLPALLWRVPRRPGQVIVAFVCVGLAALAYGRLATFSSPYRLWDDAVTSNGATRAHLVERGYVNRGMASFDSGRREEALADFERAIALNDRYADAWIGRASAHLAARRPAQALADLERALALDEGYASAWDKRCLALSELGRIQEARAACERAVALDPRNADALVNSGALYQRLGQRAQAEDSYRRALALNPAHAHANHNLGVLLLDSGRRDEIVRDYFVKGCNGGVAAACEILRRSRRAGDR